MESKRLISVLTSSEKCRDTLFLLPREPMTLSEIRNYFKISSPDILPHIKESEAQNLIRALLIVGEHPKSPAIQKDIKWLIDTQNSDENWDYNYIFGNESTFYANPMLSNTFAIKALTQYKEYFKEDR